MPIEASDRLRAAVDAAADGGSPDQQGIGGWDAVAAREYLEYSLGQELENFAQLYGAQALIDQLSSEGQRLGFSVQPRGGMVGQSA